MSELHGYYLEDLRVGIQASYARTVTETDVILYAGITGDDNPIHMNEEYASDTRFGRRIVHGMYAAGLISCVAGTRMPGPGVIFTGQSLKFVAPIYVGDTVTATCTVKEIIPERRRVIIDTVCTVKGKTVLTGEAVFMVDSRAQA